MSHREISRLRKELAGIVARIGSGEMAANAERWPDVARRLERDEARFAHISEILAWYDAQIENIMDRIVGPRYGRGRPEDLLRHHSSKDRSLTGTLRALVRDLLARGMLSREDAEAVDFDEPKSEFLEAKRRRDREAERSFRANIQEILDATGRHSESQGYKPGGAIAQARGVYNKNFHDRRHTDQNLAMYVQRLADHGLLPKSFTFENQQVVV